MRQQFAQMKAAREATTRGALAEQAAVRAARAQMEKVTLLPSPPRPATPPPSHSPFPPHPLVYPQPRCTPLPCSIFILYDSLRLPGARQDVRTTSAGPRARPVHRVPHVPRPPFIALHMCLALPVQHPSLTCLYLLPCNPLTLPPRTLHRRSACCPRRVSQQNSTAATARHPCAAAWAALPPLLRLPRLPRPQASRCPHPVPPCRSTHRVPHSAQRNHFPPVRAITFASVLGSSHH